MGDSSVMDGVDARGRSTAPAPSMKAAVPGVCGACDIVLEADHRIANHLAILSASVRMRSRELTRNASTLTPEFVRLVCDGLISEIEAVSRLHRALATRGRGADVGLGDYLHNLTETFASGLSGPIVLAEDIDVDCSVRAEQILPVSQIVSEVITNAIKYSHANGEAGNIRVGCHSIPGDRVEVVVEDDGPGLPIQIDRETSESLGSRLIRSLAARIGAEYGYDVSAPGMRFWLHVDTVSKANGSAGGTGYLTPAR